VKLSALAEGAGISPPSLTGYLKGERVRGEVRLAIWRSYKRLSGERVTFAAFWGPLLDIEKEAA